MAHPLHWPGKRFFYAIGNTSAVSLARDVAPDQDLSLLLLGCGDPRNVLFTLFSEHETATRKLDFTCVDFEPAILARNVLLLSMVIDDKDTKQNFDIFFHLYLEKEPLALLVSQCRILLDASTTSKSWKESRYGSTLRMSSEHTLRELRWHWDQYAKMHALPNSELCTIVEAFKAGVTEYQNQYHCPTGVSHTSRSAGPLMLYVSEILSECFRDFWKYGTTFVSPTRRSAANLLNPTFVYTQAGVGCHVHYGTDPVMPFHLAPIFGNLHAAPSRSDIVNGIRTQFQEWCSAFRRYHQRSLCIVRVFFADAIFGASALRVCNESGAVHTRIPVCQGRTEIIKLDEEEYKRAPLVFDVVDTSNLDDHIGLLNVLIISIPLLTGSGNGVLYLESLLIHGHVDNAPKDLTERFHADLTVMSVLFRLYPIDFIAGYSTRSNTHELLAYRSRVRVADPRQYHQVTTWKMLRSDPPVVESWQLGTFLYDLYRSLFEEEDHQTFFQHHPTGTLAAMRNDRSFHYCRESFVMLLRFVRDRLQISREQWVAVLDRFFSIQSFHNVNSQKMDTVHAHDLCGLLHFHGVYTMDHYRLQPLTPTELFSAWPKVPPLVRVFLTIPREKLCVLTDAAPILQASMIGPSMHNLFSSVHAAFGVLSAMGTPANPRASFEEDLKGFQGTKPLVISFVMPAMLLTGQGPGYDHPRDIRIVLNMKSNHINAERYEKKLGTHLEIHSAELFDSESVLVLPEQPLPSFSTHMDIPSPSGQIGSRGPISANFNEECDLVESFSAKITIEDELAKAALQFSEVVTVHQLSYNIVQLVLGGRTQEVNFPFPVAGAQHRLRLARKSLWIEIIVPPRPSVVQGRVDINPFPIAIGDLVPWGVHRLNLERLPVLNLESRKLDQWLNVHLGATFSEREATVRKNNGVDTIMFVKDTINSIIVQASGIQPEGSSPHHVFTLADKATKNCDTVLFVDQFRFDLSAHTIVCDGFILPMTIERILQIGHPDFIALYRQMRQIPVEPGETKSWKQLLPVLVERCRTWKHRDSCQYAIEGRVPLTTEMEAIPLCACGEGQDVQRMHDVPLWKPFAKYSTRIALSPLFAVSYVENVGRKDRSCCVCRAKAPFRCPKCKKDRYCSTVCQKKDWVRHRMRHHNFWEK
ncbi:hypothetical protein C8R45DRAFT_861772 [Mycena sanguinolenta]|nr:hypothetical protein C8R45DRAFT_861772 [Mycena sanguinolenta]